MNGIVSWFDAQKGYGFIKGQAGESVFVHVRDIKDQAADLVALVEGEPVEFDPQPAEKGRLKALNLRRCMQRHRGIIEEFSDGRGVVRTGTGKLLQFELDDLVGRGFRRPRVGMAVDLAIDLVEGKERAKFIRWHLALEAFAELGNLGANLTQLTRLAQEERWEYENTQSPQELPILRNYIMYTFERLWEECDDGDTTKISYGTMRDQKVACFNTGLVTELQEEIFGFLVARDDGEEGPRWRLMGFRKTSENHIALNFKSRPIIANYFKDPRDLVYHAGLGLTVKYEHIIKGNSERFPEDIRGEPDRMRRALEMAARDAEQRVRRNYKTAVPQFYNRRLQLLLPLCMTSPQFADAALVVTREENVNLASTILTLDMAYNNARLLARPDREWLRP